MKEFVLSKKASHLADGNPLSPPSISLWIKRDLWIMHKVAEQIPQSVTDVNREATFIAIWFPVLNSILAKPVTWGILKS